MKKVEQAEAAEIETAFSLLKPERVVLVVSIDVKTGKPSGMTAAWATRCSEEPQLFGISLWKGGHTSKLIRSSKQFVIAFPNKSLEKQVLFFGTHSGRDVDKFKQTGIATSPASKLQVPLIKNATANLECKLWKTVDCGDCFLFIGKIVAVHSNKGKGILLSFGKNNGKRVFRELASAS